MRFIVASAGNHSAAGELFFSIGDFHKQKSLEQFKNPDYFVTREELFSQLTAAGMLDGLASRYSVIPNSAYLLPVTNAKIAGRI